MTTNATSPSHRRVSAGAALVLCGALLGAYALPAGAGPADEQRESVRGLGTTLRLDAQVAADPAPAQPPTAAPALLVPAPATRGTDGPRVVLVAPASAEAAPVEPVVETMETRAIDPLNPERSVNPADNSTTVDLWMRVRRGFAMPDLQGDLVHGREQYYADRPDYVRRMTERGGRYLFHVVEELEKRGMPTELALLPFIESAFNPQAMSSAKASGMWQFIPSTGKDFALKQNIFRDDRRDVLASTRAALDYLERLHRMFGDWHLALAAYNWGEGSVQRAIARNQKSGLPTDYMSLNMPDETRLYVPKLQAVKNIVQSPELFGLSLPALKNHPYFLSVPIERDIDVDLAARLAGVSLEEFKQLNPQMNKPVILAAGTEQVLLPYDNANRFVDNLRSHHGQLASWTAWVAPRTLRSADAAKQVGMSEPDLRAVNRIPPKMLVKAGSTLLVPRAASRTADVSEHLADNAALSLAPDVPPLKRVSLRAGKRGETVAALAKRFRTTPAQVAQWNRTSPGGRFKPGEAIVVWVPQRAAMTTTRVAASSGSSSASRSSAAPATARRAGAVRTAAASSAASRGRPVQVATRQSPSLSKPGTSKAVSRGAPAARPVRVAISPAGGAKPRTMRVAQH